MLGYARVFLLVNFEIIFVHCLIPDKPTLSVRRVDNKLIQRKRLDTLEMCQMFEKERLSQKNPKTRRKREIAESKLSGVPPMKEKDIKRVESIVDRLYDDMAENGKPVPYRHRVTTETVPKKLNEHLFNHSNRRFDFAPSFLEGPDILIDNKKYQPDDDTVPVEWIKKWKHGIIPYFIDSRTYDSGLADVIMLAFDYFERATCIRLQRLREKPTDQESMQKVEWVYITNPMGIRQCVHSNERILNKGVQMVVFGYDCMSVGEIVHEVMHILGFSHEHTRPDRDQHVAVMWDNIKPGYKKYFELRKEDPLIRLPYDYASVLHYPPRAFSKNGKITIAAKAAMKLGQREGLSEYDVEKVALIFGNECVDRNKEYLLTTCPSVVKGKTEAPPVTREQIQNYFKDRLWPFGVLNYKLNNEFEFSAEEKENIQSVIRHIEKETCIEFRDLNEQKDDYEEKNDDKVKSDNNISDSTETTLTTQTSKNNNGEHNNDKVKSDNNISDSTEITLTTQTSKNNNGEENNDKVKSDNNISDSVETTLTTQTSKNNNGDEEDETDEESHPKVEDTWSSTELLTDKYDANNEISDNEPSKASTIEKITTEKGNKTTTITGEETDEESHPNRAQKVEDTWSSTELLTNNNDANNEISDKEPPTAATVEKITTETGNKTTTITGVTDIAGSWNSIARHKRSVPITGRRHAASVLVLKRSVEPGCKCPTPGRPKGDMILELNADCFNSVNDLLHFFVHVLGLDHQHNMHDRDDYLHIVWEKMTPEVQSEMKEKLPPEASVGFSYDYQSVMHYPWLQIKDGVTSIMYPIWNDGWAMGHWQGLSYTDVQKLSALYHEQCLERKKYEGQGKK